MRALCDIAREIRNDWRVIPEHADKYLVLMEQVQSVSEEIGDLPGSLVLGKFLALSNGRYKTKRSSEILAELRDMYIAAEEFADA